MVSSASAGSEQAGALLPRDHGGRPLKIRKTVAADGHSNPCLGKTGLQIPWGGRTHLEEGADL